MIAKMRTILKDFGASVAATRSRFYVWVQIGIGQAEVVNDMLLAITPIFLYHFLLISMHPFRCATI